MTTALAASYRERIHQALPAGMEFTPLMTAYLTDSTDPDDLERGFKDGVLFAAKALSCGRNDQFRVGCDGYAGDFKGSGTA